LSGNDGDAIAAWTDSSGNGYDLSQATGANRPTLKTGIINGQSVARFDGSNDELFRSVAGSPTIAQPYTYVTLSKLTDASDGGVDRQIFGDGSGATHFYYAYAGADIGGMTLRAGSVSTKAQYNDGATWYLHVVTFNGASSAVTENGWLVSAGFNPNTGANTSGFRMGATGGGRPFKGDIAEVIVYSAAVTNAQIDTLIAYVNTKYGLNIWRQLVKLSADTGDWTVPAGWDILNNQIEAIGGGGGGYGRINDTAALLPGDVVHIDIGTGGAGGAAPSPPNPGGNGGATWINPASAPTNGSQYAICRGRGGQGGQISVGAADPIGGYGGGAAADSEANFGDTNNVGGAGGDGRKGSVSVTGGAGGGGAGGPGGAGGRGGHTSAASGATGQAGGSGGGASGGNAGANGDGNANAGGTGGGSPVAGAGGTAGAAAGGAGGNSPLPTNIATLSPTTSSPASFGESGGAGGGGGFNNTTGAGMNGGNANIYGGGGGGGGISTDHNSTGGGGGPGVLYIKYKPKL